MLQYLIITKIVIFEYCQYMSEVTSIDTNLKRLLIVCLYWQIRRGLVWHSMARRLCAMCFHWYNLLVMDKLNEEYVSKRDSSETVVQHGSSNDSAFTLNFAFAGQQ